MQKRYGFIVSDELKQLMIDAREALSGDVKDMYKYRNRLIEKVAEEMVDTMVRGIADRVEEQERKDNINKLADSINSGVSKLVKVMLAKDKNKVVKQSEPFLDQSIAKDTDGNIRLSVDIPENFYNDARGYFASVLDGDANDSVRKNIKHTLKDMDDYMLGHFMVEFVKTLGWGAIKINLAKGAKATVIKANSVMVDKLVLKMKLENLQDIIPHFDEQLFEASETGLAVLDN